MSKHKSRRGPDRDLIANPTELPVRNPELARLDVLVGAWELRGRTLNAPVDNISGWSIFEWMPGGFYLENRSEINLDGTSMYVLEMIGFDEEAQAFVSSVFSSLSAIVLSYEWDVRGKTVIHLAQGMKFTGTVSADGMTISGGWRPFGPGDDSRHKLSYDAVLTRAKPPRPNHPVTARSGKPLPVS